MLSAEQNHKMDTSIHYNIPELQSSSRLPGPPHNGQQEAPAGRKGPLTQEVDQASEDDDEDGEEDDDEPPRRKWQGIEAIFEAYQEHLEGMGVGAGPRGGDSMLTGPPRPCRTSLLALGTVCAWRPWRSGTVLSHSACFKNCCQASAGAPASRHEAPVTGQV